MFTVRIKYQQEGGKKQKTTSSRFGLRKYELKPQQELLCSKQPRLVCYFSTRGGQWWRVLIIYSLYTHPFFPKAASLCTHKRTHTQTHKHTRTVATLSPSVTTEEFRRWLYAVVSACQPNLGVHPECIVGRRRRRPPFEPCISVA